MQAAAIIAGHVLAVLVAHMLAGRLHPNGQGAALSQLPLTVLMIAYTVLRPLAAVDADGRMRQAAAAVADRCCQPPGLMI